MSRIFSKTEKNVGRIDRENDDLALKEIVVLILNVPLEHDIQENRQSQREARRDCDEKLFRVETDGEGGCRWRVDGMTTSGSGHEDDHRDAEGDRDEEDGSDVLDETCEERRAGEVRSRFL